MKTTSIAAAILAGAAVLAVSPAFAGNTVGGTINLGLTIVDECTIDTDDIDFGTDGIIATDITTTADITIECTKRTPYAIALSAGDNATAGDVATRKMKNGDDDLVNYQLYSDGAHSDVWGKTVGTDTVDSASAAGTLETHTIHALVPSHQNVPIGTYVDHVTATIWYADDATP